LQVSLGEIAEKHIRKEREAFTKVASYKINTEANSFTMYKN
jgi:hypothetical protein